MADATTGQPDQALPGGVALPDARPSTAAAAVGGPSTTSIGTTTPLAPGEQVPGRAPATSITKPLTVGLLGISAVGAAAGAIGVNTDQGVTPSQALQAVAASYRKLGIGGRPLKTVLAEIDPKGDYQQQLNAACATFTQDNHVDVVVSEDAANDDIMASCLTKARIPRISTAYGAGDAAAYRTYPYSRQLGGASGDRRMATLISRSAAARTLTSTSRVGVIVEGCPRNRSVYDRTVLPSLKAVGVASVSVQYTRCINSFSEGGATSSQIASAVLSFASSKVDKVMLLSNFEGTLLLFFTQAAQQQGYHPDYLLTSDAIVATLQGNFPTAQMAHMSGWGWLTPSDQSRGNTASTAVQRACVTRLAAGGRRPSSNLDYIAGYAACDGFSALELALQGSHGDSSTDLLLSALDAAAASLHLASLVDGRVILNAGRHDGPARVRRFSYTTACGCFAYAGPSQEMNP